MLKAIGASTSSVGKSLNSQVAASVQKIKPEAQDSVVRKLLRGMVTRADMEGAPSSAGKKLWHYDPSRSVRDESFQVLMVSLLFFLSLV